MANLSGSWSYIKKPQFIEETVYGTLPLAAPAFTSCGIISDFDPNIVVEHELIRVLGQRQIYSQVKLGETHTFSMKYRPINTAFMKYGTEIPPITGTLTGTNATSMSIIMSALIGGTEKWKVIRGVYTDSISVEITRAAGVNVTQTFKCLAISDWGAEPAFTGGGATYAANPTGDPITGITSGVDPLLVNSVVYDTPSFSFSVNHNLQEFKPNGYLTLKELDPTNYDVTLSLDTVVRNAPDVLLADMINGSTWTARPVVYNLTPSITATFSGVKFDSWSSSISGGATDFQMEKLGGSAVAVTVT